MSLSLFKIKSAAETARIREERRRYQDILYAETRRGRVNQALQDIQAALENDNTYSCRIDDIKVREIVSAELVAAGYIVTPLIQTPTGCIIACSNAVLSIDNVIGFQVDDVQR